MLTLLHGDNISASRAELVRLKTAAIGKEIRTLDGKNLEESNLIQALQSSSLFGGDIFIVIERLFHGLGRKQKKIEALAAILKDTESTSDIVLWEDDLLGKIAITALGNKAIIREFKTPVIIFQFLDSVRPAGKKALLELYEQAAAVDAPELIHVLLVKRVHQLLIIASGENPPGMAPWQLGRLTNQAKLFTIQELVSLSQRLTAMEYAIKTGTTPRSLTGLTKEILIDL